MLCLKKPKHEICLQYNYGHCFQCSEYKCRLVTNNNNNAYTALQLCSDNGLLLFR